VDSAAERSPQTVASYQREATRLVAQYIRENADDDKPLEKRPIVRTAFWFLSQHGRWSKTSIRIFAAALHQEIDGMLEYDSFGPDSTEIELLGKLKKSRPAPAEKPTKSKKKEKRVAHRKKVSAKRNERKKGFEQG